MDIICPLDSDSRPLPSKCSSKLLLLSRRSTAQSDHRPLLLRHHRLLLRHHRLLLLRHHRLLLLPHHRLLLRHHRLLLSHYRLLDHHRLLYSLDSRLCNYDLLRLTSASPGAVVVDTLTRMKRFLCGVCGRLHAVAATSDGGNLDDE